MNTTIHPSESVNPSLEHVQNFAAKSFEGVIL